MAIKTVPTNPHWACQNCIMQLVNGQSPVDMTNEDEQDWWEHYIATLESLDEPPTMGMLLKYHTCGKADNEDMVDDECECEHMDFSTQTCALCQRLQAGHWDAITFWVKPDIDAIIAANPDTSALSDDDRATLTEAALDGNEAALTYMTPRRFMDNRLTEEQFHAKYPGVVAKSITPTKDGVLIGSALTATKHIVYNWKQGKYDIESR